jgi:hypothetical protein
LFNKVLADINEFLNDVSEKYSVITELELSSFKLNTEKPWYSDYEYVGKVKYGKEKEFILFSLSINRAGFGVINSVFLDVENKIGTELDTNIIMRKISFDSKLAIIVPTLK